MENNKLNDLQSLYLLWATILNQSQSAEQVLLNTIELFNRLGLKESFNEGFKNLSYEKIEKAMMMKPCLHRFPKNMSINLASSIYLINEFYDGCPSNLFDGYENETEFKRKLMQFRGIGEHKAETAMTILETYKKINTNRNVFNAKCSGLYRTIGQEMEILDELGKEEDYDR